MKLGLTFCCIIVILAAAWLGVVATAACNPADRASAARKALDAVDKADQTCADLRATLHPDAGGD